MAEGLRLHFRVITSILLVFMGRLFGWVANARLLSYHSIYWRSGASLDVQWSHDGPGPSSTSRVHVA
jgi:hypothetical protein